MRILSHATGLCFILIFVSFSIRAQSIEDSWHKADSLLKAKNYDLSIEAHTELINTFRQNESDDNTLFIRLHLGLAKSYLLKRGNFLKETRTSLEPIRDIIENASDSELKAQYFEYLGRVDFSEGKFENALKSLKQGFEIELKHNHSLERKMELARRIGIALTESKSDYEGAVYYADEAIKGSRTIYGEAHWQTASLYFLKAHLYRGLGEDLKFFHMTKMMLNGLMLEVDSTAYDGIQFSKGPDSLFSFFQKSMEINAEKQLLSKFHPEDLTNLTSVADKLTNYGYIDLAEAIHRSVQSSLISQKARYGMETPLNGLALIYSKKGQYDYATDLYHKAIAYSNTSINPRAKREIASIYNALGVLFYDTKQYDSALHYHEKSLLTKRNYVSESHWLIGQSHLNLAAVYHETGQNELAISQLNRVNVKNFNDKLSYFGARARVLQSLNFLDSAKFYFQAALKVKPSPGDINSNTTMNQLANFYFMQDQPDSAIFYLHRNLSINLIESIKTDQIESYNISPDKIIHIIPFIKSLIALNRVYNSQFIKSKNYEFLEKADDVIELNKRVIATVRSSFIREVDNIDFYQLTKESSLTSIETYLLKQKEQSKPLALQKMFQSIDLFKSQVIFSAIKDRFEQQSRANPTFVKVANIRREINNQKKVIKNALLNGKSSESVTNNQVELQKLEENLALILKDLRRNQPALHDYFINNSGNFEFREFQKYLRKNGVTATQMLWLPDKVISVIANGNDIVLTEQKFKTKDIEKRLEGIKNYIEHPTSNDEHQFKQFLEDAYFCYQLILKPILDNSKSNKLLIIPDGPLQGFPLEVLLTQQVTRETVDFKGLPFVLKSTGIHYASSAALLLENSKRKKGKNTSFTAWAPFSESDSTVIDNSEALRSEALTTLPGASKELEAISRVFEGSQYYGVDANEKEFKKEAIKSNIIHIATHGIINDQAPLESNLLFGELNKNDSLDDNRLYMFELYAMNLSAELAVLTACNTGAGRQQQGEGTISLARAFKYAGVKSVLMSLWLANDQSTSDIIGSFYQNLAADQGKGEALRNAKLTYLESADNITSHPFYWSHLVLSGDTSPIEPSNNNRLIMYLILGVVILVIISRVIRRKHKKQAFRHD